MSNNTPAADTTGSQEPGQPSSQTEEIKGPEVPSIRQYLDKEVVPVLLEGLSELVKKKPARPLIFLADFLESKSKNRIEPGSQ